RFVTGEVTRCTATYLHKKIYQLDLVTPGIRPCEASSRKVKRDILKRRIKARRRPVTSHRFTTRVGLASRGNWVRPAESFFAFNSARNAAYFFTVARLRSLRLFQEVLAIKDADYNARPVICNRTSDS